MFSVKRKLDPSDELADPRKRQDSGYWSALSDDGLIVPETTDINECSSAAGVTNRANPLEDGGFLKLLYDVDENNLDLPPLFDNADVPSDIEEVCNNMRLGATNFFHGWNDGGNDEVVTGDEAVLTELDGETLSCCLLTADNIEHVLPKFYLGVHMIQKFKVVYGQKQHSFTTFDGLRYEELKNLLDEHETIELSKLPLDEKMKQRFDSKKIKSKRSIASCQNILRGLALVEKLSEIEIMQGKDSKAKNNRFTNFQRRDRGNGIKLERAFAKKNNLSSAYGYGELEKQLNVTLVIFNCEGYIDYVSSKFGEKAIYFYKGSESLVFLVKNLKGFCRVD